MHACACVANPASLRVDACMCGCVHVWLLACVAACMCGCDKTNIDALPLSRTPRAVSFWDVDVEQAAMLINGKIARDAKKRAAAAEAGRTSSTSRSKPRSKASGSADKPKTKPKAQAKRKPKSKSKAAAKKDAKPPRARTAYLHYSLDSQVRETAKRAHPDAGMAQLAKILGAQWKALSDDDKAPYYKRFEDEKAALAEAARKAVS